MEVDSPKINTFKDVEAFDFHEEKGLLAICNHNYSLKLYNIADSKEIANVRLARQCHLLRFSPDGALIMALSKDRELIEIRMFEDEEFTSEISDSIGFEAVEWCSNSQQVFTQASGYVKLNLFDLSTERISTIMDCKLKKGNYSFNKERKLLAVLQKMEDNDYIELFYVPACKSVIQFKLQSHLADQVLFEPEDLYILVGQFLFDPCIVAYHFDGKPIYSIQLKTPVLRSEFMGPGKIAISHCGKGLIIYDGYTFQVSLSLNAGALIKRENFKARVYCEIERQDTRRPLTRKRGTLIRVPQIRAQANR